MQTYDGKSIFVTFYWQVWKWHIGLENYEIVGTFVFGVRSSSKGAKMHCSIFKLLQESGCYVNITPYFSEISQHSKIWKIMHAGLKDKDFKLMNMCIVQLAMWRVNVGRGQGWQTGLDWGGCPPPPPQEKKIHLLYYLANINENLRKVFGVISQHFQDEHALKCP